MTSKSDTASVRVMITGIALSALGLTTTLNTSGMTYNDSPLAIMGNVLENDMGTTTPFPQKVEMDVQTSYDIAKELFEIEMRDFTNEEAEIYRASLKEIYKPIGVNIFDIC